MNRYGAAALAAGLLALTACGDEPPGDNVGQAYATRADALEAQGRDLLREAENLRDEADRREAELDDGDADPANAGGTVNTL